MVCGVITFSPGSSEYESAQQLVSMVTFSYSQLVTVCRAILHRQIGIPLGSASLILTEEREHTVCAIAAWQVCLERNVS